MAEPRTTRADVDIEADIDDILHHYPPLVNDRHYLSIDVDGGSITVKGHTRTDITRKYLVDALGKVDGAAGVNADGLFSDAEIRLDVGRLIPVGVYANVEYGVVVLTGSLPENVSEADLVAAVSGVPGVRAVHTRLWA